MIQRFRALQSGITISALFFWLCATTVTPVAAQPKQESYFVTIDLNGIDRPGIIPAYSEAGTFFIEAKTFSRLGLIKPDTAEVTYRGRQYLPLNAITGLEFKFDPGQQHLSIFCKANCFPPNTLRLSTEQHYPSPDATPLGMFVNYDLLAERSSASEFLGALGEIGVFSDYGSGTLTFSGQDLTGKAELIRLDTNWIIDRPDKRQRISIGDSIIQHGGWGQAVRFGGIQFGTDFGLQPGFISFPTPSVSGGAALPSTAEIFVNGVRRGSVDIEPGAFTIEQPPIITGAGELQVVVRDLLGRETLISHPFYASRTLLRPGLAEYSFEAGMLRNNFGGQSFDYAEPFAAASYRRGINDTFTAGIHAEISSKRAGLGPYIDWKTPFNGVLSSAVAVSVDGGKIGGLVQLDFNWEAQSVGFSASNEWISKNFSRLGNQIGEQEAKMRTSANLGFEVNERSSMSLNYLRVDERTGPNLQIASANYSRQIGDIGSLSANISRSFGEVRDTAIFLVFTARLAERSSGSVSADRSGDRWTGSVRAAQSTPSDGGLGYRAEASIDGQERVRAGITYDSGKAIATFDHSLQGGDHTTRLGLRGGLVMMTGDMFFTNTVDDSFALVTVDDFEDVGILRDNRPVTRTNTKGKALISRLRPYQKNRISINPLDLPLTAEIGSVTMMPVPRRRSGVVVDFQVARRVAATIRVVDNSGKPLAPGTILISEDGEARFPVGFRGTAYITGLDKPMVLHAPTPSGDCIIRLPAVTPGRFPTRLGTVICAGEDP